MVNGSCFCQTVRYEVSGPFDSMMSCHCSLCRKHHGAAFATYISAPTERFRWVAGEDALLEYKSSSQGTRISCGVCGSAVQMTMPDSPLVFLPAGPLEGDLGGLKPQAHIFVASKAPWYTITDDLPQYEEYPPGFGMSGLQASNTDTRSGIAAGSCLCGSVGYEATGEPLIMQSCHCQRCRRLRGAAHGTNIFYKIPQFRWTRGADLVAEYKLPEARFYTAAFCRQCAGSLPKVAPERDLVIIPAGTLDTDPSVRPQRHVFTNYRAPWFEITDTLPQFSEAPPPVA